MNTGTLTVALVTDVFFETGSDERLAQHLARARELGADLAVLPELPLNRWCPADPDPSPEDAEEQEGSRQTALSGAARSAGIAVLGGAIIAEPGTGRRFNTALLYDASGALVASYRKLHLPCEEGFWESHHYEPGEDLPAPVDGFALPLGLQICSDVYRPVSQILGAMGAGVILLPRATPDYSWERWRVVLRATAVTSTAYVVSVNRPGPEAGVPIGGPSIVVAPDGTVVLETTDPLAVVTLEASVVAEAREEYPGHLARRGDLYAEGWGGVTDASRGGST